VGGILPYFEPLYPAVIRQCQLCGTKLGEDKYESMQARAMDAQAQMGHYLFCNECSGHIDDLTRKVEHEAASMDAEYEKARSQALRELAQKELDRLKAAPGGGTAAREVQSPAPPARASQNRLPGSIPHPRSSNG